MGRPSHCVPRPTCQLPGAGRLTSANEMAQRAAGAGEWQVTCGTGRFRNPPPPEGSGSPTPIPHFFFRGSDGPPKKNITRTPSDALHFFVEYWTPLLSRPEGKAPHGFKMTCGAQLTHLGVWEVGQVLHAVLQAHAVIDRLPYLPPPLLALEIEILVDIQLKRPHAIFLLSSPEGT